MCSVSRRLSGFTSRTSDSDFRTCSVSGLLGLASATLFVRTICSLWTRSQLVKRIIVRCSLAAGCESELLFVPEPAGKLGSFIFRTSDFTIVRYLGAARCCSSASSMGCFPSRRQNELLFVLNPVGRSCEPNKKTHANARALLKFV